MSWQPPDAQPPGWQPDNWQPSSDGSGVFPGGLEFVIGGSTIPLIDPDEQKTFTPIWDAVLPSGVTVLSVTYTVPAPLSKVGEGMVGGRPSVRIGNGKHGALVMIEMTARLSNGATMNRQFPLRCFNS